MKDKIIEILKIKMGGRYDPSWAYDVAGDIERALQPDGEEVVYVETDKATGTLAVKLTHCNKSVGFETKYLEKRKLPLKSLQPEITEWLENKIKGCDELGDMEKERWAFQQVLKKLTPKTK